MKLWAVVMAVVSAKVATVLQVLTQPQKAATWPLDAHAALTQTSVARLAAASEQTKALFPTLFDQQDVQGRFLACAETSCQEALAMYAQALFGSDFRLTPPTANDTMLHAQQFCPRIHYLLHRDNAAADAHSEMMRQLQSSEVAQAGVNATDLHELATLAEFAALGGSLPYLSDSTHQWLLNYHNHYSSNLLVGTFDQGKMLTFELLSDILTQVENWTPYSLYIAPKATVIALLKILTLYKAPPAWGDFLTLSIDAGDEATIAFTINGEAVANDYCGEPCYLTTFLEKMKGKRMYAHRTQLVRTCGYLGDDDLSWTKYYFLVAVLLLLVLMFKGSDWIVRKTGPKPKEQ